MNLIKNFWNKYKRDALWIAICLLALIAIYLEFTDIFKEVLTVIAMSFLYISLAIGMAGIAQWAYTKLDFIDPKNNYMPILGYIFLGVCIVIAGVAYGTFIALFS